MPITESWLDNQYSGGSWTGGHDHCPASLVVGDATLDSSTRLNNEQYDWVYDDPGTATSWSAICVGGCDPDDEPALP
jgi:hypothetical protein